MEKKTLGLIIFAILLGAYSVASLPLPSSFSTSNFTANISGQPAISDYVSFVQGNNILLSQTGHNITIESTGTGSSFNSTYDNTTNTVNGNQNNWNATYNLTYDSTSSQVNGNLANWNATYNSTYDSKTTLAVVNSSAKIANKPAPMFMNNATATCTDTTNGGAGKMMGFYITHTTEAASVGTGSVMVTLDFQLTAPATSNVNTQFILKYGTGTPPVCNAATTGTSVGLTYTWNNPAAVATKIPLSRTAVITGLTANTQYWFDVSVIDSSTAAWIYSRPQVSVWES